MQAKRNSTFPLFSRFTPGTTVAKGIAVMARPVVAAMAMTEPRKRENAQRSTTHKKGSGARIPCVRAPHCIITDTGRRLDVGQGAEAASRVASSGTLLHKPCLFFAQGSHYRLLCVQITQEHGRQATSPEPIGRACDVRSLLIFFHPWRPHASGTSSLLKCRFDSLAFRRLERQLDRTSRGVGEAPCNTDLRCVSGMSLHTSLVRLAPARHRTQHYNPCR